MSKCTLKLRKVNHNGEQYSYCPSCDVSKNIGEVEGVNITRTNRTVCLKESEELCLTA